MTTRKVVNNRFQSTASGFFGIVAGISGAEAVVHNYPGLWIPTFLALVAIGAQVHLSRRVVRID